MCTSNSFSYSYVLFGDTTHCEEQRVWKRIECEFRRDLKHSEDTNIDIILDVASHKYIEKCVGGKEADCIGRNESH